MKKQRINGKKTIYRYNACIYQKPHFCPKCKTKLEIKRIEKIVDSKSEEAKYYDFSNVGTFMHGNVKFKQDEFYCSNCNEYMPFKKVTEYEQGTKYRSNKLSKYVPFLILILIALIVFALLSILEN